MLAPELLQMGVLERSGVVVVVLVADDVVVVVVWECLWLRVGYGPGGRFCLRSTSVNFPWTVCGCCCDPSSMRKKMVVLMVMTVTMKMALMMMVTKMTLLGLTVMITGLRRMVMMVLEMKTLMTLMMMLSVSVAGDGGVLWLSECCVGGLLGVWENQLALHPEGSPAA